MRIEVKNEKANPFLKRKELVFTIENPEESTPSRASVQKAVAEQTKKEVEHIEIIDIMQGKGVSIATVRVNVWDEKKVADLSKAKEAPAEEGAKEEKKEDKKQS